jgi:hypothetical protein
LLTLDYNSPTGLIRGHGAGCVGCTRCLCCRCWFCCCFSCRCARLRERQRRN